jgi:RNA polymerase sigma-70 factor (ECF subfamily)
MTPTAGPEIRQQIETVYRAESQRVYATLVRLLGGFDLAEEALQDAFAAAMEHWQRDGLPENPRAWLVSTGRNKAIDLLRARGRLDTRKLEVADRMDGIAQANAAKAGEEIEDDRLRLIFTCCHPAIDPKVQVPLTLREVCGLTTEVIASSFLTTTATMAQRIVRGKAKIRDAGIPFEIPTAAEFAERLDSVLAVIYLVFNEGYSASSGDTLTRPDLSGEAIRLGRLLVELAPDPEVIGLLALMLLQESRRLARSTPEGDIVLLEDQDRALWNTQLIAEGLLLVERSIATRRFGAYTLQAAIAAVHARAATAQETDWRQIAALYGALMVVNPSPVVELNRAVAVAMAEGPLAGLSLIDALIQRGDLADYHLLHAARADLCRRLGRTDDARAAYGQALRLARQQPEIRFLTRRLAELED